MRRPTLRRVEDKAVGTGEAKPLSIRTPRPFPREPYPTTPSAELPPEGASGPRLTLPMCTDEVAAAALPSSSSLDPLDADAREIFEDLEAVRRSVRPPPMTYPGPSTLQGLGGGFVVNADTGAPHQEPTSPSLPPAEAVLGSHEESTTPELAPMGESHEPHEPTMASAPTGGVTAPPLASDSFTGESPTTLRGGVALDVGSIPVFAVPQARPMRGARTAALVVVGALLVAAGVTVAVRAKPSKASASAATASERAKPAAATATVARAEPASAPADVAQPEAPKTTEVAKRAEPGTITAQPRGAPKTKLARLKLRGRAADKEVFLDGKRMLGHGTRAYFVLCGPHTIAVGDRADARDVDLPCDGEYTIANLPE